MEIDAVPLSTYRTPAPRSLAAADCRGALDHNDDAMDELHRSSFQAVFAEDCVRSTLRSTGAGLRSMRYGPRSDDP